MARRVICSEANRVVMWSEQLMPGREADRGNRSFFEQAIGNCPLARDGYAGQARV
jgi:hypothetical protein